MIDIYDEVGYIKNILQGGLGSKWERDALLLARYYKTQGIKKSEAKIKLKEKCENNHGNFTYYHVVDFRRLNKVLDMAYKKSVPLRQIKSVEISREVLNWFLELEDNFEISDEQLEIIKKHHPKCTIKGNHPLNWKRVKMLFTLYIWTKIQENYLDKPNMHYLKKYMKRFKEDANLDTGSFDVNNEKNLLYELGFIKINYGQGIDTTFIKKYNVFEIPITDDNKIVLESLEAGEGDLYNCGKWLDKQKYGSFICEGCGKEFVNTKVGRRGRPKKYCNECAKKIGHNCGIKRKTFICIDCGKEFPVSKYTHKIDRCYFCQEEANKKSKRDWWNANKSKTLELSSGKNTTASNTTATMD